MTDKGHYQALNTAGAMMQFKPGPGRTYLYGVYGTLIAFVSGVMLYFEQRSYDQEVLAVCFGTVVTILTFLKETRVRNHNTKNKE